MLTSKTHGRPFTGPVLEALPVQIGMGTILPGGPMSITCLSFLICEVESTLEMHFHSLKHYTTFYYDDYIILECSYIYLNFFTQQSKSLAYKS